MMEAAQNEAAARPKEAMVTECEGRGEEDEREKLLAVLAEDGKQNGNHVAALPCDPSGRGGDPDAHGGHLEVAPTNGVAANRWVSVSVGWNLTFTTTYSYE